MSPICRKTCFYIINFMANCCQRNEWLPGGSDTILRISLLTSWWIYQLLYWSSDYYKYNRAIPIVTSLHINYLPCQGLLSQVGGNKEKEEVVILSWVLYPLHAIQIFVHSFIAELCPISVLSLCMLRWFISRPYYCCPSGHISGDTLLYRRIQRRRRSTSLANVSKVCVSVCVHASLCVYVFW